MEKLLIVWTKCVWGIKQLYPCHYESESVTDIGEKWLCTWRMWFGNYFDVDWTRK